MSIDEFNKLSKDRPGDARTAFTLETIPPEIEDGILALADQFERDQGHDG
ncbi:hypothetical protein ACELLULO517_21785 [Acidisoma cellulosilytica]|uniref:Methylenetetrahydrofolate reductase n=1 Tax=Acidisoma cellulosilyticum TaxID=2802395 RepID=A0A963Z6U0_9PROT|nr:hypothetical protein [Acidisoma cellulosilyticum]MCB8882893.1 hypothetical protein [Acidisoma cellulosilyticum]